MAIIDVEGIVTKETKYGDTSRILTVVTRTLGKISVLAGNVRRGKSGLLSATSLFSYSKFTVFKNGSSSLYKLNEGELITSFPEIRESLEKMAYASYFCDITNTVIQEGTPNNEQTDLTLRSLYLLCNSEMNPEKIKAVFEFRTITFEGLMADLSVCGKCNSSENIVGINPYNGIVLCENCISEFPSTFPINKSIYAAIAYISLAEPKKIYSFNMSDKSISYLSTLGEKFIGILLERDFKTLDYLKKVTSLS